LRVTEIGVRKKTHDFSLPVSSTTSIHRFIKLILFQVTVIHNNTAAFLHAPIKEDVYVQMPRNYVKPGMIIKLKWCLYGLKQSPRNFFLHVKAQLEAVGFTSNDNVHLCLFVSDKVICLIYVDDTLFFSPKKEYIDQVIQKLKVDRQMDLEIESNVSGFLGVHVERDRTTGSITLTQRGLTERIVKLLNVGSFPSVRTPASPKKTLPSHELDGNPLQGLYSYPSVISMLLYLANHTRPNISFAVAQCARYNHSPKLQHEQALEHISQYLKGTMDKGLVLKPDSSHPLDIDCYIDADFAGLYGYKQPYDPSSVKSRSGYVLCVSNCLCIWSSKLQHLIATSTTEAEYNALSDAMCEVVPLQTLLEFLAKTLGYDREVISNIKVTIHKDNAACLKLANLPPGQFTPRTKFYAVKVNWFRSLLSDKRRIVKIETRFQRADILTKLLSTDIFEDI
jgi:Reverse transcriptase (RNA-dependent DNA polymerase)